MVGVKAGHVTRPVAPRGGTLDLPLLRPAALCVEEKRRGEGGMNEERHHFRELFLNAPEEEATSNDGNEPRAKLTY